MTEPSILAAGATLSRELPNNSMQRTALRADAERSAVRSQIQDGPRSRTLVGYPGEGTRDHPISRTGRLGVAVTGGSHRQLTHPSKPSRVTVSGGLGEDMPKGTFASVRRQAGLKRVKW